jgi:hypothetical protein
MIASHGIAERLEPDLHVSGMAFSLTSKVSMIGCLSFVAVIRFAILLAGTWCAGRHFD